MYAVLLDSFYGQKFFDWVEEEASKVNLQDATIKGDNPNEGVAASEDVRVSSVSFLDSTDLRNELFNLVSSVNANEFGYDIYNLAPVQYTVYDETNNGHYHWHSDDEISVGKPRYTARKLSVTVQLSDPSEYEGGDFEMYRYPLNPVCKNKGSVLIFPSTQVHRVTPVTKGVRKSLVAWFHGPDWR